MRQPLELEMLRAVDCPAKIRHSSDGKPRATGLKIRRSKRGLASADLSSVKCRKNAEPGNM